jgi:hypothetical protein
MLFVRMLKGRGPGNASTYDYHPGVRGDSV